MNRVILDKETGFWKTDPPPPTPDGLDTVGRDYTNIDRKRYLWLSNRLLSVLEPLLAGRQVKPRLLDVGCGAGFVVRAAKDQGFDALGIDSYADGISFGKKVLKVSVRKISLYDFKPSQKYDVVVLNHVFEHITRPEEFLKRIKRLLKSGGVLLLASPNYKSLNRLVFGDRWYGFKPDQHVWQLTPQSLEKYMRLQGFKNIKLYPSSLDYNPPNIIKNLVFRSMNYGAQKLGLGDQLVMTCSTKDE